MSEEQHDHRIDTAPDAERQVELEAAYQQNSAAGRVPYDEVKIATYGELFWIFEQRQWSGEVFLPEGFERPNLSGANLYGANLSGATLEDANLSRATLVGADLSEADVRFANLSGADLRLVNLSGTSLEEVLLADRQQGSVLLHEIHIEEANLSVVDWERVPILGDEFHGSWRKWLWQSRFLGWTRRFADHRKAARAYQRLSKTLRDQNLNDEADRYAYRAQICRRRMFFRKILAWPSRLPQYVLSHFLNLIAGYGYKPERTLFAYLLFIFGFAVAYMHIGMIDQHAFTLHEALIFSLTSFHGRGFFPGGLTLDDPITTLAALEAVAGLVIEVSFIATFTQRFFGK